MSDMWLAVLVFLAAYTAIVTDKIHRTVTALLGGCIVVVGGVISQEEAFASIDFNTIGLLIGMMLVVGITRQSGVFEYAGIRAAKLAGGRPASLLVVLSLLTAGASALLDNVTTVLLIVPVTYAIADQLRVSPIPFIFAEILSSNIGGTATLIGDPPNIMIGSAAGLGFVDFLVNLGPPVLVILVFTLALLLVMFRRQLQASPQDIQAVLQMDETQMVKDWALMKKSLLVLALTTVGFFLHQALHLESATIALLAASVLMLVAGESPEENLLTVEWPTIFFFAGLFVMVGGLEATGVIDFIAVKGLEVTQGDLLGTGMLVLWLSAIASAVLDNIPFTATMIPVLQSMGEAGALPLESLWWALALGACLGGNGTLIGASANVIVAGLAEKKGDHIRFMDFFVVGFPLMLLSIVLSSLYLYLFFWR